MDNDLLNNEFEARVQRLARAYPYPSTPDIAGLMIRHLHGGRQRLRTGFTPVWVWLVALIVLMAAGLMSVPTVRAAVIEFFQIGAIRIFTEEKIPTPEPFSPESSPGNQPINPYLTSVLELAGEVSLEEAIQRAPVPLKLPTYPDDLGSPDKVFYQNLDGGWGIFLVWSDPNDPDRVSMTLLLLGPGAFAGKGTPSRMEETFVLGHRAVWTEGDHLLVLQIGPNQYDLVQLFVNGNVLIWEMDGITYRIESELSMDEAVRVAESLK